MKLAYVIKYVADMDSAVAWHRDVLGLPLGFASPFWSEFETGTTKLALHAAGPDNAAGTAQLGFQVDDLPAFYAEREARGIDFVAPPQQQYGRWLAKFRDEEGVVCSISG